MSKWMPPKPKFLSGWNTFNQWYDKEIAPLFENAVEVYGNLETPQKVVMFCDPKAGLSNSKCTHRALLIRIEPIKEETAEDILREVVANHCNGFMGAAALYKAKAYLERKGK